MVYEKNRAVYSCRDRVKFDIQHKSQMQKACVASPCIFMIKQGSFAFQECGLARWSQTTSRAAMRRLGGNKLVGAGSRVCWEVSTL